MPPNSVPAPGVSRRSAIRLAAAAPAALLLAGCSRSQVTDRLDSGADRLRAPRTTPPAPPSPDQRLVDDAVRAIAELRATLLPHRAADPLVADLVRLHSAHLTALGTDARAAAGTAAALGAAPVRQAAIVREQSLATLLARQAASAHDGELARLLAAMSAGVAQRVGGATSGGAA